VRYSNHIPLIYKFHLRSLFVAGLQNVKNGWEDQYFNLGTIINQSLLCGIFLIISVIHFLLFLSFRSKRVNLYFAIYAFFLGCALQTISVIGHTSTAEFFTFLTAMATVPLAFPFYLRAVYSLFHTKTKWWFYCIVAYCISAIFFVWYPREAISLFAVYSATILVIGEIVRISILSVKKGMPGAKLFLTGQLVSLSCFILMGIFAIFFGEQIVGYRVLFFLIFDGALILSPLLLSNILARDFSSTNRSLLEQLEHVKILSAQSLAQEQEKQQLLTSHNETLETQVAERTSDLQHSLQQLQATQSQLIQSEKMASLGELTAGIAHEIQNPLNFVNNFSEVSSELVEELKGERSKVNGEKDEALELEILSDLTLNLEKINHHGKRADAIVKGMLQHSQRNTGKKEPTDINALADEYLRLSYHGLRAKDKDFNADFKTDFDESIGKIEVVPQDIGRVLLNLYNNAFYAAFEKKKQQDESFKPLVSVSTKKENNRVYIIVEDNGNGIPQKISDKIFQPFFTTKPTGQGTGLGLSLSYDIIKAHGGELKVETKEGEGATFIVQLPT
jgi:two-component system NtrC family sensor kinase